MSLLKLIVEHNDVKMNFGSLKDLEVYMRLENVPEVTVTTSYIFDQIVPKMKMTYADVKSALESE